METNLTQKQLEALHAIQRGDSVASFQWQTMRSLYRRGLVATGSSGPCQLTTAGARALWAALGYAQDDGPIQDTTDAESEPRKLTRAQARVLSHLAGAERGIAMVYVTQEWGGTRWATGSSSCHCRRSTLEALELAAMIDGPQDPRPNGPGTLSGLWAITDAGREALDRATSGRRPTPEAAEPRRPRGRPRIDGDARRDAVLYVRLTPALMARLDAEAEAAGESRAQHVIGILDACLAAPEGRLYCRNLLPGFDNGEG